MREYMQFYINGEWVDPVTPNSLDVINPATEEVCAHISMGSEEDVNKAVAAAKTAFESYSRFSPQMFSNVGEDRGCNLNCSFV